MKNVLLAIPVLGLGLVTALASCSNTSGTPAGSGGGPAASGGLSGTGGSNASGGQPGTGGSNASGGQPGTGGSNASGGRPGTGGSNASGGQPGTGGSNASGGQPGTGGSNASGGTTSQPGTGGRSASGGTTSQPGTGGTTAAGGNTGRDGGPAAGGAGGGTAVDAGGTSPSGQSAGCGKTSTITSSQYNNGNPISITVNGSQRRYILSVPTPYDNTKPYKFILTLHARDSNDKSEYNEKYYDLQPLSNNTVIFAAPNGVLNNAPCTGTGIGETGCGWPAGNNNMQLMDAVVKQVTDNFCVDMNRIYATGWSYGASMSYEIACERPLEQAATNGWGVRAVAVYAAAQLSGSCKPTATNPVAYYATHGTAGGNNGDGVLPYSGGVTLTQNMATADGCTWQTPTMVTSGTHVCTKMAGCKTGYPVEFCSFNGGHTAYPDNGQPQSSWGPQEAWTFLSQF